MSTDWYYPANIRGSSRGRTPGSGPGNRGSNPCPRANKNSALSGVFVCRGGQAHAIEACAWDENGRNDVRTAVRTVRPGPESERLQMREVRANPCPRTNKNLTLVVGFLYATYQQRRMKIFLCHEIMSIYDYTFIV